VDTQDIRLGTPEGVPTQQFVRQVHTNQGFMPPGFAGPASTDRSFTTEDILWALGIWSVIIGLSPVIVFYMLMVA